MRPPSILPLPSDATVVEEKIVNAAYALVYRAIEDPLDKFIVAFMFDLGNNVNTTALACGLSRVSVWQRHKKIKQMLDNLKIKRSYFYDED